MATYTDNLHLEKPAQTDLYNIDVFNGNADIIDTAVGTLQKKLSIPIPNNSNLNDYKTAGVYGCSSTSGSQTISNNPNNDDFTLEVFTENDSTVTAWKSVTQVLTDFKGRAVYIRRMSSNGEGTWTYSDWIMAGGATMYEKTANTAVSASNWTSGASIQVPAGTYIELHQAHSTTGTIRCGFSTATGDWTESSGSYQTTQCIRIHTYTGSYTITNYLYTSTAGTYNNRIYAVRIA